MSKYPLDWLSRMPQSNLVDSKIVCIKIYNSLNFDDFIPKCFPKDYNAPRHPVLG